MARTGHVSKYLWKDPMSKCHSEDEIWPSVTAKLLNTMIENGGPVPGMFVVIMCWQQANNKVRSLASRENKQDTLTKKQHFGGWWSAKSGP